MGNSNRKMLRIGSSKSGTDALDMDPDIIAETARFEALKIAGTRSVPIGTTVPGSKVETPKERRMKFVPLYASDGTYQTSEETAQLLREIGGSSAIRRMTDSFYRKCFEDRHIDQFLESHEDPHFMRLANWIVEKMGGEGTVWTNERVDRGKCPVARALSDGRLHTVHDRTSAHVAAWWCTKRSPRDAGNHFAVHDSRVWMRLMFWSAREAGLLEHPAFADWYVRFIGHFVRVYERQAPMFARESLRWSADPANIKAYLANGRTMPEVTGPDGAGVSINQAIAALPANERGYTGWPYNSS